MIIKTMGNMISKNRMLTLMLALVGALTLISSCGMRRVHIRALQPALVSVPADVRTLVILNRSNPPDDNQAVIGAILSMDLPGERKAAVQEALNGLHAQLTSSSRYSVVRASEEMAGSNLSTAFPEPLTWEEIEGLCDKYEADAVVAMEVFSTKYLITEGTRMARKTVELAGIKKQIEVPEFYANGVATASIGFRLYDPRLKSVADERLFTTDGTWEAGGSTPADAMRALTGKSEAQKRVSYDAGLSYGARITPTPITITRPFYDRPKNNVAITKGTRQADSNQWYEALDTWKNGAENATKSKIASRLAYNTAIAFEVIGDFESAIFWANKSYVDYGNKKGMEYSRALRRRVNQQARLNEQLGE